MGPGHERISEHERVSGTMNEHYDVVVVGAGNAALTAAIAAKQAGSSVVVLEKAPRALRGGNTSFTGGVFRCVYNELDDLAQLVREHDDPDSVEIDPYTRDAYLADMMRVTGGKCDPALTDAMIDKSYETVSWMADLGVKWEFYRLPNLKIPDSNRHKLQFGAALRAKGKGRALSDTLFRVAEEAGVDVVYEAQATQIKFAEHGAVSGIEVRTPNSHGVISCRALVLASGGFQASPQMRTAHLGQKWNMVKVRGSRFNTGEMIRAVIDSGGQAFGQWSGCHATPLDADAPDPGTLELTDETSRVSYPYSVLLNLDGERFLDEGEDFKLYTYAKSGAKVLEQRGATAFQVFDQKTIPLLEERYGTSVPVEADTLEALADGIEERFGHLGFDRETFLKTLNDFNGAVQERPFDPYVRDGKHTKGIEPAKTNWALELDTPPFRAYPVSTGITFTFGGIRISTDAEVLDTAERAISGLYATGEMTGGFFYDNYPGGAGLMRGAVFGRIAGTNASAFANDERRRVQTTQ